MIDALDGAFEQGSKLLFAFPQSFLDRLALGRIEGTHFDAGDLSRRVLKRLVHDVDVPLMSRLTGIGAGNDALAS